MTVPVEFCCRRQNRADGVDYVKASAGVSLLRFPAVKKRAPKVSSCSFNYAFVRIFIKLSDPSEDVIKLS